MGEGGDYNKGWHPSGLGDGSNRQQEKWHQISNNPESHEKVSTAKQPVKTLYLGDGQNMGHLLLQPEITGQIHS